jgi:hypothetical protein
MSSVLFDPNDLANIIDQSIKINTPKNNKIMPAPLATVDSKKEIKSRSRFDLNK